MARKTTEVLSVATVAVGAGMAILVGVDGEPLWRLARVAVVAGLTVSAVVTMRRWPGVPFGVVAIAVGLVTTPVGAVFAVRYLSIVGWSWQSLAGLLTLVAGLVLLVSGTVAVLAPVPRWWRLLAVPLVATALYAVALPIAVAVTATNVPRPSLGSATPADRDLPYSDVTFETADGVSLSGWYLPSSNGAAVVLPHGASSTRTGVLDQAAILADNGYGVLLYDARGMGESEGRAMNFGWYGDVDLSAAVDHVAALEDVDAGRIGVVGMSMGGEQAIGAMGTDPRIRAVVAEGATNRVAADWRWLPDVHGVLGWVQLGVDHLTYGLTDALTAASPPPALRDSARAAAPRPLLLIAAGTVPEEGNAGRYITDASPETVELWIVDGAGHTGGLSQAPAEWEQRVTTFLDRVLASS